MVWRDVDYGDIKLVCGGFGPSASGMSFSNSTLYQLIILPNGV